MASNWSQNSFPVKMHQQIHDDETPVLHIERGWGEQCELQKGVDFGLAHRVMRVVMFNRAALLDCGECIHGHELDGFFSVIKRAEG